MLKENTKKYIESFNNKDLNALDALFHNNFILEDPVVKRVEGKERALEVIGGIFKSCKVLSFEAKNIYEDGQTSMIEFVLILDGTTLSGVDIIEWDNGKMLELRAYLDIPCEETS